MIATRAEIKKILQIPVELISSGALIAGQRYELLSGTGDFSNIGALALIAVGDVFLCIEDASGEEPTTEPTSWGDAVLAEYEDHDETIELLLLPKSEELFRLTNNHFTFGEPVSLRIAILDNVIAGEGIEVFRYGNIRLECDSPNGGKNYTVSAIAAGSLTITEPLFDEEIDAVLYNVVYPQDLKTALAYMIADDLNRDTLTNTKSEIYGRITRNKGGDSSFPYSDYVRSILRNHTYSEAI